MKAAILTLTYLAAVCGCIAHVLPAQGDGETEAQKAAAEIRILIADLADAKRWERAAVRLERKGKAAVEPLVEAITKGGLEKNEKTLRAMRILEDLGPVAKDAYQPLADVLGQCDGTLFVPMWRTLGTLVPFAETVNGRAEANRLVQSAMQVLTGMAPKDRASWSSVYQRFSLRVQVDANGSVKDLIREVASGAPHRREVAAQALGHMGKAATEALPALAAGLRGVHGKNPKVAVQRGRALVLRTGRGVNSKDEFEARATVAMIRIAPGDPQCAAAYGWQLKNAKDPGERSRAALQIGAFGKKAAMEVPALLEGLQDKEPRVRWEVITALGMLGPAAEKAVPKLEALAKGKDKGAAARARAALKQIRRK